jgi:hypothetical protein
MPRISEKVAARMIQRAGPDVTWSDPCLLSAAGVLAAAIEQAGATGGRVVLAQLRRDLQPMGLDRGQREAVVQAARRARPRKSTPPPPEASPVRGRPAEPVQVGDVSAMVVAIDRQREARGWTRAELASRMKIAPGNYSRMIAGGRTPSVATLEIAAEALGMRWELTD